jgi:arylsulfatase A-like enzyme
VPNLQRVTPTFRFVYAQRILASWRSTLRAACFLLTTFLLFGCSDPAEETLPDRISPAPEFERPNLLLIVADDLGYTDLGAFGGEIPTPNLDALAEAGIRLTNFHTNALCQETRAMLMSGMSSVEAIQRNPPREDGERANELRTDVATLAELLRDAGYATYMSGKWDLGLGDHSTPHARGFDRSFALLEASASHFPEPFWSNISYYQEDEQHLELSDLGDDFYSTRGYTEKFLEYLSDHSDPAPWFGYVAYTAPHWPLQVPGDWEDRHAGRYDDGYDALRTARVARATTIGVVPSGASLEAFQPTAASWTSLDSNAQRRYARAQEIYAAMVEFLDHEVGRIIEHLDRTDQLDRTLILFMSDHGASASELGIADGPTGMPPHFELALARSDNSYDNIGRAGSFVDHGRGFAEAATAPLRLFKGALSEGGIRAPAFLHYPGLLKQGEINDTFLTVMDVLPTFLELAKTEHPGSVEYGSRLLLPIKGRSFRDLLAGKSEVLHGPEDAIGWSLRGRGALIKGRYKLTNQPLDGRYVQDPGALPWQLYDLIADPGETIDLATKHPEIVADMKSEWQRDWQKPGQ